MIFPKRLREIRKEKKLTQVALGNMLGCSYATIAGYEAGRKEPSLSTFFRICQVLEVSADDLLGLSQDTKNI